MIGYTTQTLLRHVDFKRMEYVKGEEGRKDTISKLSTLLTKSTVAQEVSSSTEY